MTTFRGRRINVSSPPVLLGVGGLGIAALGILPLNDGLVWLAVLEFALGLSLLGVAVWQGYTLQVGQDTVWRQLLAELGLRGDERVLSVGCGSGSVADMVAAWLPSGTVTGVHDWSRRDNVRDPEFVALVNAVARGTVRVELINADLRALPWTAPVFDVVVSARAVYRIGDSADRDRVIREMVRVLRPRGKVVIADIAYASEYGATLTAAGMSDVRITPCGWRYWFGPMIRTKVVTATR